MIRVDRTLPFPSAGPVCYAGLLYGVWVIDAAQRFACAAYRSCRTVVAGELCPARTTLVIICVSTDQGV